MFKREKKKRHLNLIAISTRTTNILYRSSVQVTKNLSMQLSRLTVGISAAARWLSLNKPKLTCHMCVEMHREICSLGSREHFLGAHNFITSFIAKPTL